MHKSFYYIPINVISPDTVDFTMLRITTLVFWIHITPIWNWWCGTQCFFQHTMHEVLWRHSYRTIQNLYQELSLFVQILLRVSFDLVILACQLDVIHHFGSSYCYNNMYLLPVDVICYSLAAICVFTFYMVQKIDTCKSTIVIVFNIILNIPYSKLGIVMCIWNDKNTIHEYLYCLCACIYRCTRLPDISVVLLCMHRCTACIYVYNVLMMYMYFVFCILVHIQF